MAGPRQPIETAIDLPKRGFRGDVIVHLHDEAPRLGSGRRIITVLKFGNQEVTCRGANGRRQKITREFFARIYLGRVGRVSAIVLAGLLYVQPNGNGYTITDPYNPNALTYVNPTGNGGYVATQPFNPAEGLQYINPNGNGGYTVVSPFGQEPNR